MNTLIDKKLHSKLKKIIAEDGTILFIGSGISAWSGLPNWKQLINEMADYVGKIGGDSTDIRYYSNNQPLIAADLGCAALNSNEFRDFIRSACRIDNAKPSIIHHLLVSLGVTCYITTNYDQLLEQTLEQNGLLNHYKIVTNRNPIDCAGLLHLSRRNFIFKPHGDIDQDESIVLSNKNYDDLYENGTKFHTYRALETLLTTRNVIFIGFGLTDPDFIRILGKIRNEFRTNLCTHYAIMPDISQNEQKYWLENYGIQILSYETKDKEHGRDHSALIELLKSLITKNRKQIERNIRIPSNSNSKITTEQKIALGRYAKYVIQQLKLPDGPTIPLMIKSENRFRDNYVYLQVDEVLKGNLSNFVITGNPGAGKTYFLKQYCLYRANRILECYNNSSSLYPKVPIYIDLKSYNGRGSIKNLIEAQFPPEIPINKWIEDRRVILVFDSFNEIDKRYLENRSCAQEIKQYSHRNDVIVATRYKSALDIYCHEYHLEEVKDEYVIEYLKKKRITISEEKKDIIVQFLQKPLMFQLLVQGKIKIDFDTSPKNIYESYFKYLDCEIKQLFNSININFISLFEDLAYQIFNEGVESFSLDLIEEVLTKKLSNLKREECISIINWLTDVQKFLVPTSLSDISFFHQSITEFLAAHSLANQFIHNEDILNNKLFYVRWNYVLLFAVGFLDDEKADRYIEILLQKDSLLAIQACSYLESNTEKAVTSILNYILRTIEDKNFYYWVELGELLRKLPVSKMHEGILRKMMLYKDIIGGAAAGCLLRACGDNGKKGLLEELFQNLFGDQNDYNYMGEIAEVLSEKITLEDYKKVVSRLGSIQINVDESKEILAYGFDILAQYLPLTETVKIFNSQKNLNVLQRNILANISTAC